MRNQVTNSRVIVVGEDDARLQLIIMPSRGFVWVLGRLAIIVFLLFICVIAIQAVAERLPSGALVERLALPVFVLVPCALATAVIGKTIFELFGREVITKTPGILKIETMIWGIRRSTTYALNQIENLRLSERVAQHKAGKRIYRRIEFEFAAKTVATSYNLSRDEGELIYRLIAKAIGSNRLVDARVSSEPSDKVPNW